MDIQGITDITVLKSMAYDQMVLQQQIQRNLDLLNSRIAELETAQAVQEEHRRRTAKSAA
jgi:hypothetical protein